ncbi:MAG: class I SAM-dependent RNA methyltransferase [Candidatus Fermentibacteria bacterium]|nr:class I SAM-dependent RNA methyltransferase [Candidatus Fermentibacteria bacterium]
METKNSVLIESLGNRVGGIARPADSPAIFIRGALPGEQVTFKNTRAKKNYIEADLVSIEKPSQHRVKPFCSYYGVCGGCSMQHLSYGEQLIWKKTWIEKALRGLTAPELDPVFPSPVTRGYRNKVTFDVRHNKLTLHAFKGDPVPVELCPLMNEWSKQALREFLSTGVPYGITRVSVRGGTNTESSIIELTGDYQDKAPANWPSTVIRKKKSWFSLRPGDMFEKLGEFIYQVPHGGFFQVNTKAAEKLVSIVLNHIPDGNTTVLDLYGGVGTFGIPLAARGSEVTTVEMDQEASTCFHAAAELNSIPAGRLHVVNSKDASFLTRALKRKKEFETIVTDPPRAGMGVRIAKQLTQLNPARIVYVSCNPFSAARDIAVLSEEHYKIRQITPVDMFPHTDHIETVFLIERGK